MVEPDGRSVSDARTRMNPVPARAAHFMLTQPRRCAVSLMRLETRLDHR